MSSQREIKKRAVLFTDIVGSTAYFKKYGNIAGREMLLQHQRIVTDQVKKTAGETVKTVGDSVIAIFKNGKDAVEGAIATQRELSCYIDEHDAYHEFHIRIGIHFGEIICEDNDIFGNSVNLAAKLLEITGIDGITVSTEIINSLEQDASSDVIEFSYPNGDTDNADAPAAYTIEWTELLRKRRDQTTLLLIKPLPNLSQDALEKIKALMGSIQTLRTKKQTVRHDNSIAIRFSSVSETINSTRSLLELFTKNKSALSSVNRLPFAPVQMLIDCPRWKKGPEFMLTDSLWKAIPPGEAHASNDIISEYSGVIDIPTQTAASLSLPQRTYKLRFSDIADDKDESPLFHYHNALYNGDRPPCFFCGDRRHASSSCPSKSMTGIDDAIGQLSYYSVSDINYLFYRHLFEDTTASGSADSADGEYYNHDLASMALCELKKVYQLRFFRALWTCQSERWSDITRYSDDGERGGFVWLGHDCIRVSNLREAEKILQSAITKYPDDYKAYCSMGFLHIDKGDLHAALSYFEKAITRAETAPQKIFLYLLSFRSATMIGNRELADRMISAALNIDRDCPDVIYQYVLHLFAQGLESKALEKLDLLIQRKPVYFTYALIDPELAPHHRAVQRCLRILLETAQKNAEKSFREALTSVEKITLVLPEDDEDRALILSYHDSLCNLVQTKSYAGYCDTSYYSALVVTNARNVLYKKNEEITCMIHNTTVRYRQIHARIAQLPFPQWTRSHLEKPLSDIENEIEVLRTAASPNNTGSIITEQEKIALIDKKLSSIQNTYRMLKRSLHVIKFCLVFFKKIIVFETINVAFALIVLPIIIHYTLSVVPLEIFPSQPFWVYQKESLITGGLIGLFLAFIASLRIE